MTYKTKLTTHNTKAYELWHADPATPDEHTFAHHLAYITYAIMSVGWVLGTWILTAVIVMDFFGIV